MDPSPISNPKSPFNTHLRDMSISIGPVRFMRSLWRILRGHPRVPASLRENALLQTVLQRRSVRHFTADAIPADVFDAIVEAGRVAPSTVNLQSWSFAAFTTESWSTLFERAIPFQANRAVIVLADAHRARGVLGAEVFPRSPLVEYTIAVMNASLAAMNMTIVAEALGVSSVMLSETGRSGLLDAGYLREKLRLPDGVIPLTTIVFGYAEGMRPPMPPRLPIDTVCFDGASGYLEADPQVMQDWLAQMIAGYKANFPRSSFEAQLRVYQSKISRAEADLRALALADDEADENPGDPSP